MYRGKASTAVRVWYVGCTSLVYRPGVQFCDITTSHPAPLQSVPHAHVSVTRHHAIVLAGLSALMATAASPRADRPLQRTALKVAGATWLAAGLLNVYETTDGQMVGIFATAQCWHAPWGGSAAACAGLRPCNACQHD